MGLMRWALLSASENRWLEEHAPRYRFVRRAVARFMPGEHLDDALTAARELQAMGMAAILTELGENVTEPGTADAVTEHYLDVVDKAHALGLDAHPSVKLTQLGLDIGQAACIRRLETIVDRAGARGGVVWIDMESSAYTDRTIEVFRHVRARRPSVGVCLQAYLRRTANDLDGLLSLGPAIRLVKGAYNEPADRAFPAKADVDRSFLACCERLMTSEARRLGATLAVATHDRPLIERIKEAAAAAGLPSAQLHFQMLYGIQREEQRRLVTDGHRVRVLISYGTAWYRWYVRRLAERPENVLFVLKNLLG